MDYEKIKQVNQETSRMRYHIASTTRDYMDKTTHLDLISIIHTGIRWGREDIGVHITGALKREIEDVS